MQNAQIWKSINALCDEAEAVIKDGTPKMAVIRSTAPPEMAREQKANQTADAQTEKPAFAILPSQAPPPEVNIVSKTNSSSNADDISLSHATMAEIAAAIDQAGKAQKTQNAVHRPQIISDQFRHDLMTEVGNAIRNVLANELPQMVRNAVSESLYEQRAMAPLKGAIKSESPRNQDVEAKPVKRKAALKKPALKKATTKGTSAKKTTATKAARETKSRTQSSD